MRNLGQRPFPSRPWPASRAEHLLLSRSPSASSSSPPRSPWMIGDPGRRRRRRRPSRLRPPSPLLPLGSRLHRLRAPVLDPFLWILSLLPFYLFDLID